VRDYGTSLLFCGRMAKRFAVTVSAVAKGSALMQGVVAAAVNETTEERDGKGGAAEACRLQ
jgi:hypothetical protein